MHKRPCSNKNINTVEAEGEVDVEVVREVVREYVVVGHCCESGDLFSCTPGDADLLRPRRLLEASRRDYCSIEGVGGYCSSMCAKNYNSFPETAEVLLDMNNYPHLIRR